MYTMIAVGSLFSYLPFLVVNIPLLGRKILGSIPKTAYDRAGNLRVVMSRSDAFKKWKREQARTRQISRKHRPTMLAISHLG